jgi:hypothetical protein
MMKMFMKVRHEVALQCRSHCLSSSGGYAVDGTFAFYVSSEFLDVRVTHY